MSHLRQEGTDEHDVKLNTDLDYDTPVLLLLKIKISLNVRGAESCLCSEETEEKSEGRGTVLEMQ